MIRPTFGVQLSPKPFGLAAGFDHALDCRKWRQALARISPNPSEGVNLTRFLLRDLCNIGFRV